MVIVRLKDREQKREVMRRKKALTGRGGEDRG